jgi:hypothetical protein
MYFIYNFILWFILFFSSISFKYLDFKKLNEKSFVKYLLLEFGFKKKFNLKTLGKAFALSLLLFLINFLISYFTTLFGIGDLQNVKINPMLYSLPFLYICLLIFGAFFEELFFRAFLTDKLGIIFSSIIFGIMHYSYGSYVQIIGSIILGLILAYVWKKTRNFYIVYLGHLLQNLYAVMLILLL